jgi:ABC-2 type transport system ATP-binding protein
MARLEIQGVSFLYPGAAEPVLREVTLDIPAGGVFGLLGPNGAGKTTLLSLIAGQRRGATGRLLVQGSLGLVPQECAFYPMLSCRENLRFFAAVQGIKQLDRRIDAVASLARIESVLGRPAGELSGGLKRRLNLAIGLLTEPQILLLDEPTVGVDPQSRAFLLDTVRSLASPERIVIYTSHYMEEVQAVCDRVAIMDHGRVLLADTLAGVLEEGAGHVRLRLSAPLPARLQAEWRVRYSLLDAGDGSYQLRIGEPAEVGRIVDAAVAAQCRPLSVAYGRRDLEQVFMQLTQRSLRD